MSGDAELFNVEGRKGITGLKAAPVRKHPATQPSGYVSSLWEHLWGHNYPHNEVQGTVTSEIISLLIMRPGYDCRNDGELLKLKQHGPDGRMQVNNVKGRPEAGF